MMRPPRSLMAPAGPDVVERVAAASTIAAAYAADQDPQSAKEMLAAGAAATAAAEAPPPIDEVKDPETAAERAMRPTRAPERGVDWGDVATEGSRVVRSGAFNTILKAILGMFGSRKR